MNIDNIKGQFKDYARSNLFNFRLAKPKVTQESETGTLFEQLVKAGKKVVKGLFDVPPPIVEDMLDLAVKSTKFPSIGMKNPDLEYRGYKIPTVGPVEMGEFEATFICDHDMVVYQFFVSWLNEIINPETGVGVGTSNNQRITAYLYQVRSDLKVDDSYRLELHDLFPKNISEIALGEDDGFMEFTVSFNYSYITNNAVKGAQPKENLSLLDKAKKGIGGLF